MLREGHATAGEARQENLLPVGQGPFDQTGRGHFVVDRGIGQNDASSAVGGETSDVAQYRVLYGRARRRRKRPAPPAHVLPN